MPPKTLDEQQREWLDAALAAKGRFTRAAGIRKDFEAYKRRRDKVAAAMGGLPPDGAQAKLVANGLDGADAMAKDGRFSEAYKALDAMKATARAATASRAAAVSVWTITASLAVERRYLGDRKSTADFAVSHFTSFVANVQGLPKLAASGDVGQAAQALKDFAAQEVLLRADLADRQNWVRRSITEIGLRDIGAGLDSVARDIAAHEQSGNGAAVAAAAAELKRLRTLLESEGGRYAKPAVLETFLKAQTSAFEAALKAIKDLSGLQVREGAGEDDLDAMLAQYDLKVTQNMKSIARKDKGRIDKAEARGVTEALRDIVSEDSKKVPVIPAREPAKFDAGGALFAGKPPLPDDITVVQAEALVAEARTKMSQWLAAADPRSDALLDLILQSEEELAAMASGALTGVARPGGLSQSHAACFKKMAAALKAEIQAKSPNRMADDASSITVNGVAYQLQEKIGEGGNGAVRRYVDPATGKTVVVKSVKGEGGNPEERGQKRKALADEMRTHRKVLNGDPTSTTDDDNIIRLKGAAVSGDGSLHMMMEDADGGDLGAVANGLSMLTSQGVLPEEARKVLALDFIAQTAKGMKAMAERGLVHNDLKAQNLLLNKDGTVKIIDFGESRFVDDKGEAPSAAKDGFTTTPGYEAPETYRQDTVDQKADSHALAGLINTLMSQNASEEMIPVQMNDATALGRVVKGLQDKDPAKRPSLDAVLASSLLTQVQEDHDPEQVKALRKAAAETSAAMANVKGTLTAQELIDNAPAGRGMTDAMWVPHFNKIAANGGEVPIAAFQAMPTKIDVALSNARNNLAKARPEDAAEIKAKIAKLEGMKKFWIKAIDTQLSAAREEGKTEVEATMKDPAKSVEVPGVGRMTAPAAVKLRRDKEAAIARIEADFAVLAGKNAELAADRLPAAEAEVRALRAEIVVIGQALAAILSPKARYALAESNLKTVAASFGPTRGTGGAKGAPAPQVGAAAPPPPVGEDAPPPQPPPVPPPPPPRREAKAN